MYSFFLLINLPFGFGCDGDEVARRVEEGAAEFDGPVRIVPLRLYFDAFPPIPGCGLDVQDRDDRGLVPTIVEPESGSTEAARAHRFVGVEPILLQLVPIVVRACEMLLGDFVVVSLLGDIESHVRPPELNDILEPFRLALQDY